MDLSILPLGWSLCSLWTRTGGIQILYRSILHAQGTCCLRGSAASPNQRDLISRARQSRPLLGSPPVSTAMIIAVVLAGRSPSPPAVPAL